MLYHTKKTYPVKILVGIGLALSLIGLIFYNTRDVVFGAPLTVHTAPDGTTLSDIFEPISGIAKHAKTVQINGRDIAIDRFGHFNDGIVLSPGYNIVEVALKDKFGNEKKTTYHWVVEQNTAPIAAVTQ